jgi:purine-binding chemotaxis protein CheW
MAAFVLFKAAGQTLALPAAAVVQVLRMAAPAPAPGAPPHVRGVLNVRGTLFPVVEARALLGAASRPPRAGDRLLLVADGDRRVALEVDDVIDVRELADAAVAAPPDGARSPLVAGALRLDDGVVLVQAVEGWLPEASPVAPR